MANVPLPSEGGGSSSGSGTPQVPSGDFYVVIYFRQVKPSTAGKVKLQARAYFYYPPYSQYCNATLKVYLGTSSSGTQLLNTTWTWTRDGSSGYHTYYSDWYNLAEVNNATSIDVYAECQPHTTKPNTTHSATISNIRRSWNLTRTLNSNIASLYYSITDNSGLNESNRTNQTASSAIVYDGDSYSWSATASTGYTMDFSSGSGVVSSDITISPIAIINTYRVTISQGDHTTIVVMNGPNVIQNGSYVNYGSNLTISISADPGYAIKTRSPDSNVINNVSNEVFVSATAEPMSTVRMKTSSGWGLYLIHIRSNGTWAQYQARIKDGSGWGVYS